MGKIRFIIALTALSLAACGSGKSNTEKGQYKKILNVSYDVSRDFFKAYNPLFVEHFRKNHHHIDLHI